ncbi:S-Ena type endospore appendage [Pontibacillus sp. HMF3514]|uniref:S-Ena type endospore appendage n=1 Tax=Pontibacillus sp. HMF3514 TaxID=2692425 RepID=UPI0013201B21|nr:S-Ena type endospore appendage [Pontibacillus sp. HMF3514]QHE51636.1 hypothetical protein GS400_06110 [Pontibacillus sp. HMF3514]
MSLCSGQHRLSDIIQNCVSISADGIAHVIWDSDDLVKPCGTFTVKVLQGNMRYRINYDNNLIFPISEGKSEVTTIDNLRRLELVCDTSNEICKAEFCLQIHYTCC